MKQIIKYVIPIILIIIFTFSVVPKTFQNDTFYIIPLGESIIENGLDRIDHYSWHEGLEYRYPHWAFDVINAIIYNSNGLDGLYVFVCIIASLFMITIYCLMLKNGIKYGIAFVMTLIVTYCTKDAFSDRAQIISYLMYLIEIALIESFLKNKNKLSVVGLVIVSCVIANIHATAWIMFVVLFMPYIGEYIFSLFGIKNVTEMYLRRAEKQMKKVDPNNTKKIKKLEEEIKHDKEFLNSYKERENAKIIVRKNDNTKWLILVMFIAILGALITPIGATPFTYYIKTSVGNSLRYISEHMPIVPASNLEFLIFTIIVIAIIGFTDSKLKLSHAFLLLGLYLMSLTSQRNTYLLIPLCAIPITKMIDDFVMKNMNLEGNIEKAKNFLMFVFSLVCIAVLGFCVYNFAIKKDKDYIDERVYPVKASEWIKNNLDVNDIKLYNNYDFGSYLLWQGIPVFIDSRCDLYTPEFNKDVVVFDDFMGVQYGEISYEEVFKKYEITHAIISKDSIEQAYMKYDENCVNIYEDDNFVIYEYQN